ncbi:MAG: hypothetical protein Q9205_006438 [Flavoplaca limonia]
MDKDQLKQRLEEDMLAQGINAPIHNCSFQGKLAFVYVRFSEPESAAMVQLLWKPSLFGDGASIKSSIDPGTPLFMSSAELANPATQKSSKADIATAQKTREVTLMIPNNSTAKSRLSKMDGVTLMALIEPYLKDQGIRISIEKCKRSARSKRIRLWTTTVEELPQLLEWKPNLPNYLGKGSGTWVRT